MLRLLLISVFALTISNSVHSQTDKPGIDLSKIPTDNEIREQAAKSFENYKNAVIRYQVTDPPRHIDEYKPWMSNEFETIDNWASEQIASGQPFHEVMTERDQKREQVWRHFRSMRYRDYSMTRLHDSGYGHVSAGVVLPGESRDWNHRTIVIRVSWDDWQVAGNAGRIDSDFGTTSIGEPAVSPTRDAVSVRLGARENHAPSGGSGIGATLFVQFKYRAVYIDRWTSRNEQYLRDFFTPPTEPVAESRDVNPTRKLDE